MLRFLLLAASAALIAGCDTTPTLIGTWDGEMPDGQTVKTKSGDMRPNLVLELHDDHHFHASLSSASLDGIWDQQGQSVILHLQKGTINGRDLEQMRKQFAPILDKLPPNQKAAFEAYDPSKPWTIQIQNEGKNLYLPSRGQGIPAFKFRKSM